MKLLKDINLQLVQATEETVTLFDGPETELCTLFLSEVTDFLERCLLKHDIHYTNIDNEIRIDEYETTSDFRNLITDKFAFTFVIEFDRESYSTKDFTDSDFNRFADVFIEHFTKFTSPLQKQS